MNANILKNKLKLRRQRKRRIRSKISGTATHPRLTIFRSNRFVSAQVIDDESGSTLVAIHGKPMNLKANKEDAKKLGEAFATALKEKGINAVVFDRNGYLFHGVVASFAQSLRENAISF